MKNSFWGKLLILIALVVTLVCTMSVLAFAEEVTDETTGEEAQPVTLNTPYGDFVIPAEYADSGAYPWVSFKKDGTFIVASNIFCNGSDTDISIMKKNYHTTPGETHYVFLREDFTHAVNATFWNFAHIQSPVIIDLLDHTFTVKTCTNNGLFFGEGKSNNHVQITMKNGNYVHASSNPYFKAHPGAKSPSFTFVFEDMHISFASGLAPAAGVGLLVNVQANTNQPQSYSMTFIDSTIDMTNLPAANYLCVSGNQYDTVTSNVVFKGGNIIGNLNQIVHLRGYANKSFSFEKNEAGEYTTCTTLSDTAPTRIVSSPEGLLTFKAADVVTGENGTFVYKPTHETSEFATANGWLPNDGSKMVLFNCTTQEAIYSGNKLMDYYSNADHDAVLYLIDKASENYLVYFRDDVGAEAFTGSVYNLSRNHSTLIFEMNGHTLTLANTLFRAQIKSTNMVQKFMINGGTINLNGRPLIQTGSNESPTNGRVDFVFNQVNFTNINSTATLISDNVDRQDNNHNYFIDFNDCVFNTTSDYTGKIINLNKSVTNHKITFNGGTFNCEKATLPTISYIVDGGVSSVTFAPGEAGKYPVFISAESATELNSEVISTPYGKGQYLNVLTADGKSTWNIVEVTPYGYIPEAYMNTTLYPFAVFRTSTNDFLLATAHLKGGTTNDYALYYIVQNIVTNDQYVVYMRCDYTSKTTENTDLGTIGIQLITEAEKTKITIDLGSHTLTLASSKNTTALFYVLSYQSANGNVTFVAKNGTISTGNEIVYNIGQTWNPKFYYVYFENVHFTNIKNSIVKEIKTTSKHNTSTTMYFTNCTFDFDNANTSTMFNLGTVTDSYRLPITIYMNGGCINYAGTGAFFTTNNVDTKQIFFGPDANGNYTTIKTADATPFTSLVYQTSDKESLLLYESGAEGDKKVYVVTPFTFVSTYLNLTHDINFVYRVFLSSGYINPVATFTVGGDTVTVEDYTIDENGLYCFKFTGIAPHKMGDIVSASVSATYGELQKTIVNEKVSVKNYADALRTQYAEDTDMLALLDNLLVYGAASQVYMNYNLDALVAEIGELSEVAEAPITLTGEASDVANIVACGLLLDGAFDLRVGIKANSLEGLTLDITKGDVTTTVTLTEDMIDGEYIVVYYDGLYINELDSEVTFTLKQNGEVVGKTLTFSANAYLYRMQTSEDAALANLTKALYAYGMSAKTYNA
ncbi:MAG: hypothetical protein IKC72_02925 [Clostridia bacterium]|nr:hypothetical protein [Clostridia bacterium]